MSLEHDIDKDDLYEEENGYDDTGEICFENESVKPKSSKKKKSKNEHRKTKKRKHIEVSDDSSDDNLLSIKNKQEMLFSKKKLKKNKKEHKSKKKSLKNSLSNLYVKQEIFSEHQQNESDESEEDIPLSRLERDVTKHSGVKVKIKKTYEISNSADTSDVEGKVKKLKLKKVNDNNAVCVECNKTFTCNIKYKAHVRKVHGPKTFVCLICFKAFQKEKDLLNHHNTHTGQNPYCCGQCGKLFKSDGSLKKHIRIYHADDSRKYACSMCPKVLSSASCLEEHERLHTGESPWACNLCGKLFARERDLKLHANLHEELFKCDVCQRCFITSFKLKEHYRCHTGETPYECDKCDRKFSRLADYRYHIGTHLGLKPFACDLCDIKFTTSSSMKRHLINMHQQGPLDFKCHICGKGFHTQSRLNSHVKNHENKKKYTCHLCNATRSSQSELQRHLILHSGEFRCDTCNRNCSSAQRLAAHVAKHDLTGKPYACFVCSLGYQTSQSLNKHLATIHKNEDIPKVAPQHLCTLCGNVFDHKDKLNRHLKDDHIVLAVGEIHSLLDDQKYGKSENIEDASQATPEVQIRPVSPKASLPTKPKITVKKEDCLKIRTIKNRKKVAKKPKVSTDDINSDDVNDNNDISNSDSSKPTNESKINNSELKLDNSDKMEEVSNQQSNGDTTSVNLSKSENVPSQEEPLLVNSICVKLENVEPPLPVKENEMSEIHNEVQNTEEIIENLARKNIENYLHKQEEREVKDVSSKLEVNKVESKISNEPNSSSINLKQTSNNNCQTPNEKHLNTALPYERNNSFPECESNYKFSDSKIPNMVQKPFPDTPTSQLYSNNTSILNRDSSHTKKEIESIPQEPTSERDFMASLTKRDYLEPEQKVSSSHNTSHVLSNFPQITNYFDDVGVKDLSGISDNKNLKTQHKYDNTYDNLYSKMPYSESLSQQNKMSSQSTYKNMNDVFDNYNQTQNSLHQATNPWYLSNKMSSLNQDDTFLKQNMSRSYTEPKQKDTKSSRMDMFQMQLHGYNQYGNQQIKTQMDPLQDILASNTLGPFHKDNYYDKKSAYNASNLEHRNYFDNFNQKQFLHDDRKRSTGAHLYDEVTKQSSRSYQPLAAQLASEHNIPSFNDQLNYYNPHAFTSMASSPHFFQNFRELQQRMLNSGIPAYNHHSRQHLFSGMDMSNQRMVNTNNSYNQMNSNINNMSPLTHRQPYNDLSLTDGSIPNYSNNRLPTNTSDGQGKDDENGPYELRVAAN